MLNDELVEQLLKRMASSITPSTVRNQGPKGTMARVQAFLSEPRLIDEFSEAETQESFSSKLDSETASLGSVLLSSEDRQHGQYWGTARKCLNIFLFECSLNRYLCPQYNLARLEEWFEVPLDSLVGYALEKDAKELLGRKIPAWDTIKGLTEKKSEMYQEVASEIAAKYKTYRVHLELRYWTRAQDGEHL